MEDVEEAIENLRKFSLVVDVTSAGTQTQSKDLIQCVLGWQSLNTSAVAHSNTNLHKQFFTSITPDQMVRIRQHVAKDDFLYNYASELIAEHYAKAKKQVRTRAQKR